MSSSAYLYGGAATAVTGLLALCRPLPGIGIRTRRQAAAVAIAGAVVAIGATLLPDRTRKSTAHDTLIDQWLPEWQFGEYHERRVHVSPQQVFAAIKRISSSDIFLFRTLTFIRNPRRRGQAEHILNPARATPILDAALAGGFALLGEAADRELLVGMVVIAPPGVLRRADPARFRTLAQPGFARAVMNFRLIPEPDGWTRVTTETRIHAVDLATQRRFARYWRVIYPGSWLIRWNWLRAIDAAARG